MKKTLCVLIALLLLTMPFAGCSGHPKSDQPPAGGKKTQESAQSEAATAPEESTDTADLPELPAAGNSTVAESYTAYLNAKNAVLTKLTDGISNNDDTVMAALSFLGVAMVDMAALPVSCFGAGQQATEIALSMVGATDVKYTENGNSYTITYSNNEKNKYEYSGTYDPAADALTCTGTANGSESVFIEYRKTAFGYAGQCYMLNDDGTAATYMFAVDGENGTIGISTASEKPAPLTASVSADFPKACSEWYSIYGTTITGKTSDGKEISFEYTPSESN